MLTWGSRSFQSHIRAWPQNLNPVPGLQHRARSCGTTLASGAAPWPEVLPPPAAPLCCLALLQSLGSHVKQVHSSLTTRKRGPSPAPHGCNFWQLIFFCRIYVCNPHFHVGIPLRPVLRRPAVQTGWLIKGILFVKQSPTSFPLLPSHILSPSILHARSLFIITHPHSLYHWFSPLRLPVLLWPRSASG